MAFLMIRLWHLAIVVMVFSHISTSLPSLGRNKRQVELKLMHDAGMRREYEKAAKLLQTLMNYKRSVPNTPEEKDASGLFDKNNLDLLNLEEKFLKLKTCLQFAQNLDTSLLGNEVNDAARVISHSTCQQIAEMSEAASGAASDENQD